MTIVGKIKKNFELDGTDFVVGKNLYDDEDGIVYVDFNGGTILLADTIVQDMLKYNLIELYSNHKQ